ncbi:MAG: uncharacterized protein KVP18_003519 [Porospora cf. gigantea A]|uniref:uncharacterized protein n=1 Tax=Porospora cf. gigantea A TaxID=2853593 RepID=UPI003559F8B3|nr:MAG: hypothetical protein KVP18_003519 [Porospora cf. gigantea A]
MSSLLRILPRAIQSVQSGVRVECFEGRDLFSAPTTPFTWNSKGSRLTNQIRKMVNPLVAPAGEKEKVIVVGTGWAAVRFLKNIDVSKYDVTVVSPRPYFTCNPLLPSVAGGALGGNSVKEPIDTFLTRFGKKQMNYRKALVDDVDVTGKRVHCKGPGGEEFDLPYDRLVYAVGSGVNTFGIPGVAEHAYFLKELDDAIKIQKRVAGQISLASLPGQTDDTIRRLLHFVIVGGGPTGVEAAAEIHDLVKSVCKDELERLRKFAKVTVIEMAPTLLPTFPEGKEFTVDHFKKIGINLQLNSVVSKVTDSSVSLKCKGVPSEVDYGTLIWASGVGQVPLSKKLMSSIPAQHNVRPPVLHVDQSLQLRGAPGVYALGDCAFLEPQKMSDFAGDLYEQAKNCSTGAGIAWLQSQQESMSSWRFPQLAESCCHLNDEQSQNHMTMEAFTGLLKRIDSKYRPPIPTAQNANQAGRFLSHAFNKASADLPAFVPAFRGQMAYIGEKNSIIHTPSLKLFGGASSSLLWRTFYWQTSHSLRTRVRQVVDYLGGSPSLYHHECETQKCS